MTTGMAPTPPDTHGSRARPLLRVTERAPGTGMSAAPGPRAGRSAARIRGVSGALVAALLATAATSCRGPEEDRDGPADEAGGLVAAEAPAADAPVDVSLAARDPGALLRAAAMPHHQVSALLGSHVYWATSSVEVTVDPGGDAEAVEQLEVTARIELDGPERFRAVVESSADYGREIIFAGGHLHLRPRHGRFHRRAPDATDEPARLRDQIYAELHGNLDLFATGLAVRDGGDTDMDGRPVRRVELARVEVPHRRRPSAAPQHAWRSSIEVEELSGEILLDRETGVPLAATLDGVVHARRDGRLLRMRVSVEHGIETIGEPVTVTPPEDWVATSIRSRELEERERLLKDIAQPARPAPTPANTPTGASRGARAGQEAP